MKSQLPYKSLIFLLFIFCFSCELFSQYLPPEPKMSRSMLKDFINMHLQYPKNELEAGIEGTVLIQFKINRTGEVTNRKVIESVSPGIDSSAMKLFDMILWDPATELGKAVDGTGRFDVKFNTNKYKSLVKKRGYDEIVLPYNPVSKSASIYYITELSIPPKAILTDDYKSLPDFIGQNLEFPQAAQKLSLKGEVKISFIIEPNGLPSNICVSKPLGGGCSEEAIRIVEMIRWIPGIRNSEAVRTSYTLSVFFNPADQLRNKQIPNQSSTGI